MRRGRPRHQDILTPREWEVLALLRDGLSNEQIAQRLRISESGARYHVSEILSKLGVSTRQEAAAWQPEVAHRRPVAVVGLLSKKLGLGVGAKIAAGAVVAGSVAVLGIFALGHLVMKERQPVGARPADLGKLAYVQNGDIWVEALPNSVPRRLTEDGVNAAPEWSPSGDWLSFVKGAGRDQQVWLVRGAGTDARRLDVTPDSGAWAPASDRLAYLDLAGNLVVEGAASGRTQVVVALTAAAGTSASFSRPVWSPDGAWLAYAENRVADPPFPRLHEGIWIVRPDGSDARELLGLDNAGNCYVVAGWSPAGDGVLFSETPACSASIQSDGQPLQLLPLAGGPPRDFGVTVISRHDDFVAEAPNGTEKTLAVVAGSWREVWSGKRVALLDLASGQLTYLTDTGTAAMAPAWSPDAGRLAYVAGPDIGNVGGGSDGIAGMAARRIWVVDRDGTNARRLTADEAYREERPLWSTDGSQILFVRIDVENRASLWRVDANGGVPAEVAGITQAPTDLPVDTDWFGYYGHVEWSRVFDWWQGQPVNGD